MKDGNKDALPSGRDRHTAKNYITIWNFPLITFFFNVINGLFLKICVIIILSTVKYGLFYYRVIKKNVKMHERSFHQSFMVICLFF